MIDHKAAKEHCTDDRTNWTVAEHNLASCYLDAMQQLEAANAALVIANRSADDQMFQKRAAELALRTARKDAIRECIAVGEKELKQWRFHVRSTGTAILNAIRALED